MARDKAAARSAWCNKLDVWLRNNSNIGGITASAVTLVALVLVFFNTCFSLYAKKNATSSWTAVSGEKCNYINNETFANSDAVYDPNMYLIRIARGSYLLALFACVLCTLGWIYTACNRSAAMQTTKIVEYSLFGAHYLGWVFALMAAISLTVGRVDNNFFGKHQLKTSAAGLLLNNPDICALWLSAVSYLASFVFAAALIFNTWAVDTGRMDQQNPDETIKLDQSEDDAEKTVTI